MVSLQCTQCRRPARSHTELGPGAACPSCGGLVLPEGTRPRRGRRARATVGTTYASLPEFLADDPRRIPSAERDLGLVWHDEDGGPLHRACWVVDTGELVLVRSGPVERGGGRVEVLAVVRERSRVEQSLAGWRDVCGLEQSLSWLRDRAGVLATGGAVGAPA